MIKLQNNCDIIDAIHIQNFVKESGGKFTHTGYGILSNTFNYHVEFDTNESYVKFNHLYDNYFNPPIYTEKPINKLKRFARKLLQLF